jgi:hypothetical protein
MTINLPLPKSAQPPHFLDARFAVWQIERIDNCPHDRTPFSPATQSLGNVCFKTVSSAYENGFFPSEELAQVNAAF